jgi:acetylcholinesterase
MVIFLKKFCPLSNKIFLGVVHHDDLIYLFYISVIFPYFDETYPEIEMVEKLSLLWANFAKTGYYSIF